jgi:hypothetical protein
MLILVHMTDEYRCPIINLDHLHILAQQAHAHDTHKEAAKDGFLGATMSKPTPMPPVGW